MQYYSLIEIKNILRDIQPEKHQNFKNAQAEMKKCGSYKKKV